MIPVLYEPKEKNFNTNGVGLLVDAISCVVEETRNGAFELVLKYPDKGNFSKYIAEDYIIKAKPNDTDEEQLFRIYGRSKPIRGSITWKAEHISYELNSNPVSKVKITGKNATEAIDQLLEDAVLPNEYTAWSDITTRNNTEIDEVISVRKALGGTEGSILDVWGGEYRFNNYRVELWKSRGKDNGVQIRYGKNMLDATQEKNISNVITAIFPYCYYTPEKGEDETETPDPIFVSLPEKTVKSPNIDKYARIKCEPIDFSDQFEDGTIVTEAMLRKVAAEYVTSGIDEPEVSIKTTFAALHQTKEYENIKALEKVGLCDIVTVVFEDLDTAVKAKIIKYSYDVLKERFESIEIGEAKTNLTKEITKQQNEIEKTIVKTATRAEVIQKNIEKTILNITAAITGNSGGHVVLRPEKNPEEILVMDTDDTATAKNVWRWNLAGFGHSSNGVGGPFTTAITADGQIVADFITAGKLTGLILEAGTVKAEALDILYKQSVETYANNAAANAAAEAQATAIQTSETRISAVKGEIQLEVKELDIKNRHNYITNGDASQGSEGWYFSSTTYITTATKLGKSCFKIQKPNSNSAYMRIWIPNAKAGKWILRFKVATDEEWEATARVQSNFYSQQTTPLGEIKATQWTTIEREITVASDASRYLYFYNIALNTTVYITDIELLGIYKDYADANFKIQSDEIAAEVTRAKNAEATLQSSVKLRADEISAEVTRAKNAESTLQASIKVNADAIKLKVTSGDVSSLIEQKADSIRLKAAKIAWTSTYSSMTSDGKLTCQSATILGEFETRETYGSSYKRTRITQGVIKGYLGNSQYGLLDLSAIYSDGARHVALKGFDYLHLQAGTEILFEQGNYTRARIGSGGLEAGGFTGDLPVDSGRNYAFQVKNGIITGWYYK